MIGRIIKGIAGFYYISTEDGCVYECKAKGIFRNQNIKPLIGDYVTFAVLDDVEKTGNITEVLKRENELIRPAVSNVDQAMMIFAVRDPDTNFNLLDRFLLLMSKQNIETIICFNKIDKVPKNELHIFDETYKHCGSKVVFISAGESEGVEEVRALLHKKTTVLAGPSGVGKSTIMNLMQPEASMEVGCISEKIKRGKHTTRHSELIYLYQGTYLFDTPGFTSLSIQDIEEDDLKYYMAEFEEHEGRCKYRGCNHINEPDCSVKNAVLDGRISSVRYQNYIQIYNEVKSVKKY